MRNSVLVLGGSDTLDCFVTRLPESTERAPSPTLSDTAGSKASGTSPNAPRKIHPQILNAPLGAWAACQLSGKGPAPRKHFAWCTAGPAESGTDPTSLFLCGGMAFGTTPLDDTYELKLSSLAWSVVSTKQTFTRRYNHAIVSSNDCLYLFGGCDPKSGEVLADLWALEDSATGKKWCEVGASAKFDSGDGLSSPAPRQLHSLAVARSTGDVFLYGGVSKDGVALADVWFLDTRSSLMGPDGVAIPIRRWRRIDSSSSGSLIPSRVGSTLLLSELSARPEGTVYHLMICGGADGTTMESPSTAIAAIVKVIVSPFGQRRRVAASRPHDAEGGGGGSANNNNDNNNNGKEKAFPFEDLFRDVLAKADQAVHQQSLDGTKRGVPLCVMQAVSTTQDAGPTTSSSSFLLLHEGPSSSIRPTSLKGLPAAQYFQAGGMPLSAQLSSWAVAPLQDDRGYRLVMFGGAHGLALRSDLWVCSVHV